MDIVRNTNRLIRTYGQNNRSRIMRAAESVERNLSRSLNVPQVALSLLGNRNRVGSTVRLANANG
jgi:hypothetical protein